jgi:hypothetical protein
MGGWTHIAQARGWQIYEHDGKPGVPPSVWRGAIYGKKYRYPRQAMAKKLAVELVKALYGIVLPQSKHHTAEAIHLGAYVLKEVEREPITDSNLSNDG